MLIKRKAIDKLIIGLSKTADLKLLIIGNGPEEESLKRVATAQGVSDRCLFLGYRKNAYCYYSMIDIYTMTSISEGFPLALLEAIEFNLPIVCPNSELYNEIFRKDEAFFYTEYDDLPKALHEAGKARKGGTFSLEDAQRRYSWERMSQSYLDLFRQLNGN